MLAGAIFPLEFEIAMGNGQACMRVVGNLTMLMTGIGRLPPFTILPIKMQNKINKIFNTTRNRAPIATTYTQWHMSTW